MARPVLSVFFCGLSPLLRKEIAHCFRELPGKTWQSLDEFPDLRDVMIFADNDSSGVGQAAAHDLKEILCAAIAGLEVSLHIPAKPNTDWNYVLLERQAWEAT